MLPEKSALLEFARIRISNFKVKGKEQDWLPARYIAFILQAGTGDKVGMIDLGNADNIDSAILLLKEKISQTKNFPKDDSSIVFREVFEKVFEPLKKELGETKELFVSPDGILNLIPFEILQGPDGKYLIEKYTFNYLAAGRDIVRFGEIEEKGQKALVMGGPDYDLGTENKNDVMRKLQLEQVENTSRFQRSADMEHFYFNPLPGAREEAKTIGAMLGKDKASVYTGPEAIEELLNQKIAPVILHLATHGFFIDGPKFKEPVRNRGFSISSDLNQALVIPKMNIENPMLRSGIALAGANNSIKTSEMDESDGIVTAVKILGLRLRGTDMVVLSACDTGLGEVKTGEGVYGLRRAFIQSGTKSLVMSMWQVPDQETKELMVEFYKNYLSGKLNRSQALRQAALKQIQVTKERYGNANPYYWGAFLFLGEP